MNAVRSMLSERQVPKEFWSEVTRWSMHIQIRSPTVAVADMTPEEAWSGTKPAVKYFRVFGCIGYVHIRDQKRRKLDDKSKKCVFLSVSEESEAWKLYDPVIKKIVISKDVVFDEDKSWDWDQVDTETKDATLECEDEEEQQNVEEEVEASLDAANNNSSNGSSDSSPPTSPPPYPTAIGTVSGRGVRERRTPG